MNRRPTAMPRAARLGTPPLEPLWIGPIPSRIQIVHNSENQETLEVPNDCYADTIPIAIPILLFTAALVAPAADTPGGESATEIDTDAERVLRHFSDFVTTLKTASLDVSFDIETNSDSSRDEANSLHHFAMERPDKFALTREKGKHGADTCL